MPPLCSSSNFYGTIIDIKYFLNLNFDASGLAMSKDLTIPIVIGIPKVKKKDLIESYLNCLNFYEKEIYL